LRSYFLFIVKSTYLVSKNTHFWAWNDLLAAKVRNKSELNYFQTNIFAVITKFFSFILCFLFFLPWKLCVFFLETVFFLTSSLKKHVFYN